MDHSFDPRWQPALASSRFLSQLLNSRPALPSILSCLWETPLDAAMLAAAFGPPPADEAALKTALRHVRQQAMAHLALRDLCHLASLEEVMAGMTLLAEFTTNAALSWHHATLAATHGEPLDSHGQAQRLMVLGMGKLGGGELNVSSDVDYIFIYPEDGDTSGPRKIENYDFFSRLGKRLIAAIGETTADGQVFRVDMRLRPNGDSGPLVCSIDALENYFIAQGREWERYAWIKARLLNQGDNLQTHWLDCIRLAARPFVFRKYLDFGAINAMRDLHAQIRREVARKDMADHIKLGPGGIREIEFMAQVYQLIRGGRDPGLQVRPTLAVLKLLVERRLMPAETEAELNAAYGFLRRLEHRLQWADDQQTHRLPQNDDERLRIAQAMDFADWPALLTVLDSHRQNVSRHFEAVFSEPDAGEHPLTALWLGQMDDDSQQERFAELGFEQPAAAMTLLNTLRASSRYQQLPAANRERLDAVGPRLLAATGSSNNPDATLQRALTFLETISRRGAYLALLQQYPQALQRVADLLGGSSWGAEYLTHHPLLLDELLDPRLLEVAIDWTAFRADLQRSLASYAGDTEREMDILREMHHAQVFRLLVQDISGLHSIERISDNLTELADILIQETLALCWQKLKQRHRAAPAFAVIGYGKLGGKELGYASDLDLVYLYDDADPDAQETYTRLGQRLNTWFSSRTQAGILFETDLRLRPNGDAGMLAVSLASFADYQEKHAWVWEHQALTRARFIAGDAALGERFEAIRLDILCRQRDAKELRHEVLVMRQKMLASHGSNDAENFDIKQDPGGIIDVEFIVQYLVLANAAKYPELCANIGNIGLLQRAAELGLIPAEQADAVRAAYRDYRRRQHEKRLNGHPAARIARSLVAAEIAAVRQLWEEVFGADE